MASILPRIPLTETEREVFNIFLKTVEHYGMKTTVRAAGGWVRDKLMNNESDDIDIAVDDQSGEDFANKVSRIGVVKANPDQSKHLATACLTLQGISFDMNNLRTETYTEDSRIPQIEIGTAQQDSERRDFCINAMFYNLNEDRIEDLVGGLNDLEQKMIRTPLDPIITFTDDPLRVLRSIRFTARLDFNMDNKIIEAAQLESVREFLNTKVSRERIGIEVEKMIKHKNYLRSIELFTELKLIDVTFKVHLLNQVSWIEDGLRTMRALRNVSSVPCRLAAYFITLSDQTYLVKNKPKPVIYGIIRDHLVLSTAISEESATIAIAARTLRSHLRENITVAKILIPVGKVYGEVINIAEAYHNEDFSEFRTWLTNSGLIDCWNWKPLFNGKQLMELGIPKGKSIGIWTEAQKDWMYTEPSISAEVVKQRILDGMASTS